MAKSKREQIKLESTANGARVKTYSSNDGDGHVRNITWTDVEMHDVHDCIVVTDAYKKIDDAKYHVEVSDLHFENVKGDAATRNLQHAADRRLCSSTIATDELLDVRSRLDADFPHTATVDDAKPL